MYKFLRIYDVKTKGNEVLSARHEVLSEFEDFNYDELMEQHLINICKSKNMPDINEGCMYSVVKYVNNILVADEAQLFYHTDDNTSFLDVADWDARIITGIALGCDLSISKNSTLNNNVHNDKLDNSYEEYRKLCDEYSQKVKYPEYGEWCKESIFKVIKEHGISDNEEYLITKVFNPNSDLYDENFDCNDLECVLGWINYKPQYKESLFDTIYDGFYDVYTDKYEAMNKELANMEYECCTGKDILAELIGKNDNSNIDLFYKALEEIGVNGFKEFILQLV